MKCPKCHSSHEPGANFCQHCGAELGLPGQKPRGLTRLLVVLVGVLCVCLAGYFFKGMFFPFSTVDRQNSPVAEQAAPVRQETSNDAAPDKLNEKGEEQVPSFASPSLPPAKESLSTPPLAQPAELLPVGVVSVYDSWGNEIAVISAVVVDQRWVALPARACFGGVKWLFRFIPTGFSVTIDGGQWRVGEDVGLWHLAQPLDMEPVQLHPWQPQGETIWRSLLSRREIDDLAIVPDWQQGEWLHAANASLPDEPGVLLQNNRVTGWTFGGWLGGGFLWAGGSADEGREMTVTVAEFYDKTFAGGREEQFVRALAMDTGPAEKLQALLAGFLIDPKLDARDVPESLLPANMLAVARLLAEQLYQQGAFDRLARLLEEQVISRTADFGLLKIAAEARIALRGFADALDFVEKTGPVLGQDGEQPALQDLRLQLYQLWAEDELAKGNLDAAAEVLARSRAFFADDPRLHLAVVELALAQGDWAAAEDLLGQMAYPDSMAERVDILARQISQQKMREGEIVIPFDPGSRQIHVRATVNNRVTFPFLVDTGASVVSIPSTLLPALGLKIDRNTPRYKVSTAGGIKDAWEITLSSIELDGWVVRNVRALVVDSDQQIDFGLLGLNFLDRFQMHLDSDEGVLILRPQ